jgi:hypothetical protein
MAGPLAGVPAAEIVQQLQDQAAGPAQPKQGPSKFDAALSSKVSQAEGATATATATQNVRAPEAPEPVHQSRPVEQAGKVEKGTEAATARAADPVAQKSGVTKGTSTMAVLLAEIEKGQAVVDKLIKGGVTGKNFSHSQMLALQASVYRYTQELELTGKVVEKATTGLKDTLKTQV